MAGSELPDPHSDRRFSVSSGLTRTPIDRVRIGGQDRQGLLAPSGLTRTPIDMVSFLGLVGRSGATGEALASPTA